jgi:hypothetical protein
MAQDVWLLQTVREHQLLVAKELVRWTVGNDGALIQYDRPGTQLDYHLEVVCGNDLRRRN